MRENEACDPLGVLFKCVCGGGGGSGGLDFSL